jgi:circadian clock protein KaiC
VLLFDETKRVFLARAAGLGMDLELFADEGMLMLEPVNPAELSQGNCLLASKRLWKNPMPGSS